MDVESLLKKHKKLHFVGIGGSGMYPLVQILFSRGYEISGSDNLISDIVEAERNMGIEVSIGHSADNIKDAEILVTTAALLPGNPEVMRAERLGIPVIPRAELLGFLTGGFDDAVCISGTHGKTTTASMLTTVLFLSGMDPSAVIGGKLPLIGGYGRSGKSGIMVCEACEFADTFLKLDPSYSVILNIDRDHLDYFKTVKNLKLSFRRFAEKAKKAVIANKDDKNTVETLEGIDKKVYFFGESEGCDFRVFDVEKLENARYRFSMNFPNGSTGDFTLSVPGKQNVSNAAAALASAHLVGCDTDCSQRYIREFTGSGRRFEKLGVFSDVTIVDDYAHPPAEIEVTLTAAKEMGFSEVIAVFQPFTFSRTKTMLNEFAEALSIADKVVLTEIMGAREKNTFGVYTTDLVEKIPGSVWFKEFEQVAEYCTKIANPKSLIITLGCGDVYKVARMIAERLKNR